MKRRLGLALLGIACALSPAAGQELSQRGFAEATGVYYPADAVNDHRNTVGDFLIREEAFAKWSGGLQLAGALDVRANTYDQVQRSWHLDVRDRGTLRPALSLRRLSATFRRGPVSVDAGKQFIRWGKTDIVTPTDRFAPRDFLNVVDSQFLAVTGARVAVQLGEDMVEAVWVPWLTPSRTPLLDQRWTVVPEWASGLSLVDISGPPPEGAQAGLRWSHTGTGYELAISFFDGFKHLPNIDVRPGFVPTDLGIVRRYPDLRSYGFDIAVPTRWFTLKTESSYATSSTAGTDEYVLYVVQLERQTGEWLFVGGYAGEIVTADRAAVAFAPDRGLTRAFVGRASYTLDVNRSWAVEGAVRQNAHGAYVKGEYSQARGQHWRATLSAALIAGRADDFLGQYRRNSHLVVTLRYSF